MTSSYPRKYDSSLFTGNVLPNDVRVQRSLWVRTGHFLTTDTRYTIHNTRRFRVLKVKLYSVLCSFKPQYCTSYTKSTKLSSSLNITPSYLYSTEKRYLIQMSIMLTAANVSYYKTNSRQFLRINERAKESRIIPIFGRVLYNCSNFSGT